MDPITAAALTSLAGSLGGEAGRNAWQGLAALVRRPFRRAAGEESGETGGISSGELELAALRDDPDNTAHAQALATALGVRAALDAEFGTLLEQWWRGAAQATAAGNVNNTVNGTQNGPVIQGRDFSHMTFHFGQK
ncbi:hypothetical protein [Streptomyces roseochromogenus]|uniref:Uncharacterized protein n=1 Tax=Streptomyces roseochromogenus subsp. oscitans DS 12.976 TaxID=1352936 RepID=V6KT08_STRRC|nr:hypothetical protein [Streptomyces roseochromogenus]EST35315.1 hypothetical protein M878_06370 [Streptomyces roseochromogenus subsp. oscitans DS 12.976]